MKAQLWTYHNERLYAISFVEIDDDYDGDPYGDKVHFAVGSNQTIVTDPADWKNYRQCPQCGGLGTYASEGMARYGDEPVKCPTCDGEGEIL
jgi:hypothetical protein